MISPAKRIALITLLLTASGCGGSGGKKTTYITYYPDWPYDKYERIAVLPVRYPASKPEAAEAARQATFMLEDSLAANGGFEVLERDTLKDVLTEQDLSQLADVADPSTIIPPGKIKAAQAMIVGKITEYDLKREREDKRRPIYAKDNKGNIRRDRRGRPIVVREEIVSYFRHEGMVAGSVRVIDTATGKIVHSHSVQPIVHDDAQRGAPPRAEPEELAVEAAKEMAVDFYTSIAPIKTEVKLKSDMLVVALDYYDGEYDKTKEVPTTLDKFMIAVRQLPQSCDRNAFRVAIAPEEGRNIFTEDFVWSSNNPVRGQMFRIPVELLREAGAEKFEAKLYSVGGEEPLLTRSFKLVPPEEEK